MAIKTGIAAVHEAAGHYGWELDATTTEAHKVRFRRGNRSVTVWHATGGRIVRAETYAPGGGWKRVNPGDGLKLDTVRSWLKAFGGEPQETAQDLVKERPAVTDAEADTHRLFKLAVRNARTNVGDSGWRILGHDLQRALILAEVTQIAAAQDSEAAGPAMIRLAEYAVVAVNAYV